MKICLILLSICNLIDTIATLYFTTMHDFIELNPVMNKLLQRPFLFVVVKLGIVAVVIYRLWVCRQDKLAQIAAVILAVFYGAIAIYYISCFLKGGFL